MNMPFTPGPWELGGTLASGQHCIIGDGDTVVALLPDETMHCTYKPDDARLIAAAPLLLAVAECEEALSMRVDEGRDVLERHGWVAADRFDLPATEFVARLRRAAIAAATEETA